MLRDKRGKGRETERREGSSRLRVDSSKENVGPSCSEIPKVRFDSSREILGPRCLEILEGRA